MAATPRVNWAGDAGFELVEMRKEGKTYTDILKFFYAKYGVSYTPARISQVVKKFKLEGRL
jgi:hypothetical protein